jgi:hypothetical protein
MDERHCEIESPSHATGIGPNPPVSGFGEPHAAQQRRAALRSVATRKAMKRGLETDQLAASHQWVKGGLLKGDTDRQPDRTRI